MKSKIISIVGPTGVGKSRLAMNLAKTLNAEIISCDSMQVYRGMDIGTAKVTKNEQEEVKHYLIDVLDVNESYNVQLFQKMVREKIDELLSISKQVILVGGTGLYLKAVLYDYEFENSEHPFDETPYLNLSNESLHQYLSQIDKQAASTIHMNNRKRVMRAIEIFETTGISKTEQIKKQKHELIYPTIMIGLYDETDYLYDRINHRVDEMMKIGLLDEARTIYENLTSRDSTAAQAIGYKELFDYFENKSSLENAVNMIKQNSRRYAKKQYTWFKNQMSVEWFKVNVNEFESTYQEVLRYILKEMS